MADAVAELVRGFSVVVPLPMPWSEMDDYRHVNNVVIRVYE